jgi:flagellar basal-body rod protein FlgB
MSYSRIQLLEKFIDYCSVKNQTISKNIANIGTTNYRRQDVSFEDILSENVNGGIKTDNPRHINIEPADTFGSEIDIINDLKTEGTSEVNNVNLEKEMSELAKNTLNYRFAAKKIGSYYKDLQSAIRGGGGQ